ncbi:type III polyketide synthase [Rariglobus hedericola]|uniref:Stilbene synthase n=1 Tax=Rariglobus hedericola TaxID=2597822 RepID=A0A556QMM4_9BACT|nr:3-oxoacyl-[acyl-carrier-protein] synthase III C-terminal domain-containing protein [Rariglobus hedericola]TSJ77884.1 stilbene synthase [Rariglobus hedericola]
MYLHALATAVPPNVLTQPECWEIMARSHARQRLSTRSLLLLEAVLKGESGIAQRHFAVPDVQAVFDFTPDQLNEAFLRAAPELAGRALTTALAQAGLRADELDALVICTCTGYICPGVTSYVAEQLGLRPNVFLQDLVGHGCGAAVPALRATQAVLAAQPSATVACIAVEICSAAFFLDDDPGVLISACLFSDGAAASIWRASPSESGKSVRCHGFNTLHRPELRDTLRFEMKDGKLRNLLHKTVPNLAAAAVSQLLAAEPASAPPISRILAHAGGREVIKALETALPAYPLDATREVLRDHGNMSSPSVMFALEIALRDALPDAGHDWWLVSFGAGFSAHSCRLSSP